MLFSLLFLLFLKTIPISLQTSLTWTTFKYVVESIRFLPEIKYDLYILGESMSPNDRELFFKMVCSLEKSFIKQLMKEWIENENVDIFCIQKPVPIIAIDKSELNDIGKFFKGTDANSYWLTSTLMRQVRILNKINLALFNNQLVNVDISLFFSRKIVSEVLSRHLINSISVMRHLRWNLMNPNNDKSFKAHYDIYLSAFSRASLISNLCHEPVHMLFFQAKSNFMKTITPEKILIQWAEYLVPRRLIALFDRLRIRCNPNDFQKSYNVFNRLIKIVSEHLAGQNFLLGELKSFNNASKVDSFKFQGMVMFLKCRLLTSLQYSSISLLDYEFLLTFWKYLSSLSIKEFNVFDPCEFQNKVFISMDDSTDLCISGILLLEDRVTLG